MKGWNLWQRMALDTFDSFLPLLLQVAQNFSRIKLSGFPNHAVPQSTPYLSQVPGFIQDTSLFTGPLLIWEYLLPLLWYRHLCVGEVSDSLPCLSAPFYFCAVRYMSPKENTGTSSPQFDCQSKRCLLLGLTEGQKGKWPFGPVSYLVYPRPELLPYLPVYHCTDTMIILNLLCVNNMLFPFKSQRPKLGKLKRWDMSHTRLYYGFASWLTWGSQRIHSLHLFTRDKLCGVDQFLDLVSFWIWTSRTMGC